MPIAPAGLRALGHEHEVIDVVTVTVLLEQLDGTLEFRQLLTGGGRLHPLGAFQIPRQELGALPRALGIAQEPRVELGPELRAVLPDHPGDRSAGAERDVRVQRQVREDLLPEHSDVAVGDRQLDDAGVHHLQDVLGLEALGR
jgi:hypothetical protein